MLNVLRHKTTGLSDVGRQRRRRQQTSPWTYKAAALGMETSGAIGAFGITKPHRIVSQLRKRRQCCVASGSDVWPAIDQQRGTDPWHRQRDER